MAKPVSFSDKLEKAREKPEKFQGLVRIEPIFATRSTLGPEETYLA